MDNTTGSEIETDCVVVGGGPAGMMLGLLLARGGVRTTVLERHADFLRDFRGDTVHPSTQEVLSELGLLDAFLELPHADMPRVTIRYDGSETVLADFSRLPTRRKAVAFLPQWDFLAFLAAEGDQTGLLDLRMSTRATGLLRLGDRVAGVEACGPDGTLTIRARLVVAADGRDSDVRRLAGLTPHATASPIDVLWFRLPKPVGEQVPFFQSGHGTLIAIDRGDFWQVARVIAAGGWDGTEAGLARMRAGVAHLEPQFAARLEDLDLDDVHLLRVRLERLRRWWRDGLLVIGDAAHAMSPAGGVGINLAIQDAVAAANILGQELRTGTPSRAALARVQRRRAWPALVTQTMQRAMQHSLLAVRPDGARPPVVVRLLRRFPALAHLTGRLVGLGARPEHARGGTSS